VGLPIVFRQESFFEWMSFASSGDLCRLSDQVFHDFSNGVLVLLSGTLVETKSCLFRLGWDQLLSAKRTGIQACNRRITYQ
jgi:hypothetical protein